MSNNRKDHKRTEGSDKSRGDVIIHIVIPAIMILLIIAIVVMIRKWNKGQVSDYDPDEVTTEFDTEPNDYILPLNAQDVAGKPDDGRLTILTLGNSPFADSYDDNNLAEAIGRVYGADVINCGIEDSYISCRRNEYSDEDEEDGVSLPCIVRAMTDGDYSIPERAAALISEQASAAVDRLKSVDLSSVDCIVIMYDLEDYVDHRPLGSESVTDITSIYGAVRSSLEGLREAYPYIRIVYLSQPASGKTIDDFYVDGDIHDIGEGLLSEYVTFELEAAATAGTSFIDIYYGVINVDVRDEYLVDDYHINDAGADAIASRMYKLIPLKP